MFSIAGIALFHPPALEQPEGFLPPAQLLSRGNPGQFLGQRLSPCTGTFTPGGNLLPGTSVRMREAPFPGKADPVDVLANIVICTLPCFYFDVAAALFLFAPFYIFPCLQYFSLIPWQRRLTPKSKPGF